MKSEEDIASKWNFAATVVPILTLVTLLGLSVSIFGEDSSSGPNQIALILSGLVAAGMGALSGHRWSVVEPAIANGVAVTVQAILILLAVGSLIGTWILSGTVPTMIYYGLQIVSPDYFYVTSCIICSLTALGTGSSWSSAGTVGIGLMGVAMGLGLDPAITAGSVISGSYFGDKMSPLSDTTNLAPAVAGTDLFTHIRHMTWTTIPSISISLLLFLLIGLSSSPDVVATQEIEMIRYLEMEFDLGPHLLLPLLIVIAMAIKKQPAFPTMMIGALVGGVFALVFQPDVVKRLGTAPDLGAALIMIKGVWSALFEGYTSSSVNDEVNELLTRGGMNSMLNTVWLIISAMFFGSVMEKTGALRRIVAWTLTFSKTTSSLVVATVAATISTNILAADQYISIVLPGRMYKESFDRQSLDPKNLSRILEDAGTVTSPLVPWNTCGAFMAATLGIATWSYFPYCFFNLLSPVITAAYGIMNFKIDLATAEGKDEPEFLSV